MSAKVEDRQYQDDCITNARNQLRAGKKRVLLVCPTGGGKTVIASKVIHGAVSKGSRSLFLAHRTELIDQTVDKLSRFGVRGGVIQSGRKMQLHLPVQVAMVQTLINRMDALSNIDLIFVDEAHHVTLGNTYAKLLQRFPAAKVIGLTATPWRLDGKGLADVFDAHVIAATPKQLRDWGFLVPVGGWEYESIDTTGARVSKGDFKMGDLQTSATSKRIVGDIIAEYIAHANGKRAVLFATSIEHSQMMAEAFLSANILAEHVDGNTPADERAAILKRLATGETQVVCNCNVLTEGFDCPAIEVIILARPTLSTSLALQMIGRGLRPSPGTGKTMCRIHDHAGVLAAHGHPYAERDYSPEKEVKGERSMVDGVGQGGGGSSNQRRCTECKSYVANWPCDVCGFEPPASQLLLEHDLVAQKRAILDDGRAPKAKRESDGERADKWKNRYLFDTDGEERFNFYKKMVARHGLAKGGWVYRWASGKSESPRPEWVQLLASEERSFA